MAIIGTMLRAVGLVWLVFASALIAIGHLALWYFHGFDAFQAAMSPFNAVNWLLVLITLAPGLGLLKCGDTLAARAAARHARS